MEAQGQIPLLRDGGLPHGGKTQNPVQHDGALRPILMHLSLSFSAQAAWGPPAIKGGNFTALACLVGSSGVWEGLGSRKHEPGGSTLQTWHGGGTAAAFFGRPERK